MQMERKLVLNYHHTISTMWSEVCMLVLGLILHLVFLLDNIINSMWGLHKVLIMFLCHSLKYWQWLQPQRSNIMLISKFILLFWVSGKWLNFLKAGYFSHTAAANRIFIPSGNTAKYFSLCLFKGTQSLDTRAPLGLASNFARPWSFVILQPKVPLCSRNALLPTQHHYKRDVFKT